MPYQVNHHNIYRVSTYLDQMLNGGDKILVFPEKDFYFIQQALYCAKVLKNPKYGKLRGKWTIKRQDKCYAIPKGMIQVPLEKPEPRLKDVINPNLILTREKDGTENRDAGKDKGSI